MCPLYRAQPLMFILSFSPMWDRMDNPMDPHVSAQSLVFILSYSHMSDRMDNPLDPHVSTLQSPILSVHPILQSHVDRLDNPMDPHVSDQSLVSILSYSPMSDRMDICFMYVYTKVLGRHFMQLKYSNNVAYALIKSTFI